MTRRILIIANPNRPETLEAADVARTELEARGMDVLTETGDEPIDAVMVFGGDGTMLRAAREAQGTGAPLLGVNMGHVGFLAELERGDVVHAVHCIAEGDFQIEERRTVEVTGASARRHCRNWMGAQRGRGRAVRVACAPSTWRSR